MKADDVTEKEVMAILNTFNELYSKQDLEGLLSLFSQKADPILFGIEPDEKRIGLDNIKLHFKLDWTEFEFASVDYTWSYVSSIGNVAWVASDLHMKIIEKGLSLVFPCFFTMILEKQEGKWSIVHMHYSIPFAELPYSDAKKHSSQLCCLCDVN
jgi:ketosteroid isomerase-like protein